jgi:hypothetical protein
VARLAKMPKRRSRVSPVQKSPLQNKWAEKAQVEKWRFLSRLHKVVDQISSTHRIDFFGIS